MVKPPFVWLGSRRAKKRGVGDKGVWLDEAASAGIPVPAGGILLDEFYHLLLQERVIALTDDRVTIPDPEFLHDTLYNAVRFPKLESPVALRSAVSFEVILPEQSLVLPHHPQLSVVPNDPKRLSAALAKLWTCFMHAEHNGGADLGMLRRDVLLMEMVHAETRGDAFTAPKRTEDWATYSTEDAYSSLRFRKLGAWRFPEKSLPSFAQRLQRLLRGVRRTFGGSTGWQTEWLDDGRISWLIQLQPYDGTAEHSGVHS